MDKIYLIEALNFTDWVSNQKYVRCINGEWIQSGTGQYNTVAKTTKDLYDLYLKNMIPSS